MKTKCVREAVVYYHVSTHLTLGHTLLNIMRFKTKEHPFKVSPGSWHLGPQSVSLVQVQSSKFKVHSSKFKVVSTPRPQGGAFQATLSKAEGA